MDPNVEPRRLVSRLSNVSGVSQLPRTHNNAGIHSLTTFPVRFSETPGPYHSPRVHCCIVRNHRHFKHFLITLKAQLLASLAPGQ
jgi:hypothetical protein